MEVKIYGAGCPKCQELAENVRIAVEAAGVEATVEKVTDLGAIVARGVLMAPALEVDGRMAVSGRVASAKEIAQILTGGQGGQGGEGRRSPAQSPKPSGPRGLRRFLGLALFAFAVGSLAWEAGRGALRRRTARAEASATSAQAAGAGAAETKAAAPLKVYYFHGTRRCRTCNAIERLMRETIADQFADDVAAGRLAVESVNVEEPGNGRFVADFQLVTRTVVLQRGDRHERLDRVWELVRDETAFRQYVADAIRRFLA